MDGKCVAEIRKWLAKEVPEARTDDKIIQLFLAGCKQDSGLARRKIKNYYEMRRTTPEWFLDRNPDNRNIRELLSLGVMLPLPVKDNWNRTVMLVRATANDPKANPMTDVFKVGMMVVDLAMELDETITNNGIFLIVDLDGVGLSHALQMTPSLVKRAVHSWQDCYPIRLIGIDFVNCPPHVNLVLNLFKSFMKEKMRKRIRIHGKGNLQLTQFIPRKCLPTEYGGTYGPRSLVVQLWKDKVLSNKEWFL